MQLPKIDINALPDVPDMIGQFGANMVGEQGLAATGDLWVVLMVYLYDVYPNIPDLPLPPV